MIECYDTYDAFMLQAREPSQPDGDVTLVGEFIEMPDIAKHVMCGGNDVSTVADKGILPYIWIFGPYIV